MNTRFDYLELACYGMTYEQISRRCGVGVQVVRQLVLKAARIVGRLGFWKFHVASLDDLYLLAPKLLLKMDQHGLRTARREAA